MFCYCIKHETSWSTMFVLLIVIAIYISVVISNAFGDLLDESVACGSKNLLLNMQI